MSKNWKIIAYFRSSFSDLPVKRKRNNFYSQSSSRVMVFPSSWILTKSKRSEMYPPSIHRTSWISKVVITFRSYLFCHPLLSFSPLTIPSLKCSPCVQNLPLIWLFGSFPSCFQRTCPIVFVLLSLSNWTQFYKLVSQICSRCHSVPVHSTFSPIHVQLCPRRSMPGISQGKGLYSQKTTNRFIPVLNICSPDLRK